MLLASEIFLVTVGGLFTACAGLFDMRANADPVALSRSLARFSGSMFLCLSLFILTAISLIVRINMEGGLDSSSTAAVLAIAIELGKVRDNIKRLLTVLGSYKELRQAMKEVAEETADRTEDFLVEYPSASAMAFRTVDDSDFVKNGVLMILSSWKDAWYNLSSIFGVLFGWLRRRGVEAEGTTGGNKGAVPGGGWHVIREVTRGLFAVVGRVLLLPLNFLTMLMGAPVVGVGLAMMLVDVPFGYLVWHAITRRVPSGSSAARGVDISVSLDEIFSGIESGAVANVCIADVLTRMFGLEHGDDGAEGVGEPNQGEGKGDFDEEVKDKILATLRTCASGDRKGKSPCRGSWWKVFMHAFGFGKSTRSKHRDRTPTP